MSTNDGHMHDMFKPCLQDREYPRERVTKHDAQVLAGSFGTITKLMLKKLIA